MKSEIKIAIAAALAASLALLALQHFTVKAIPLDDYAALQQEQGRLRQSEQAYQMRIRQLNDVLAAGEAEPKCQFSICRQYSIGDIRCIALPVVQCGKAESYCTRGGGQDGISRENVLNASCRWIAAARSLPGCECII